MANEELQIVRLRDDFYRDGFYRVLLAIAMIALSIGLLIAVSSYVFLTKPAPVVFPVGKEWRVLSPVPVDQPYLRTSDLIQWVSNVIPSAFTYDFIGYPEQLKDVTQYFTPNGWRKFLEILNTYVNYNAILKSKMFVNASAAGAPFVVNKGMLVGRYSWWVEVPITINYNTNSKSSNQPLVMQVLVVRVPTLNNLYGVGIDNIVVPKEEDNQADKKG